MRRSASQCPDTAPTEQQVFQRNGILNAPSRRNVVLDVGHVTKLQSGSGVLCVLYESLEASTSKATPGAAKTEPAAESGGALARSLSSRVLPTSLLDSLSSGSRVLPTSLLDSLSKLWDTTCHPTATDFEAQLQDVRPLKAK